MLLKQQLFLILLDGDVPISPSANNKTGFGFICPPTRSTDGNLIKSAKWGQYLKPFSSREKAIDNIKNIFQNKSEQIPTYYLPVEYIIIESPFSTETGELTANLKLRRNAILAKHNLSTHHS